MQFGEMMDLITCDGIFRGAIRQKQPEKEYTIKEILSLR